jgi:hypothetical protein
MSKCKRIDTAMSAMQIDIVEWLMSVLDTAVDDLINH